MFESLIVLLIYIAIAALIVHLVIYVLGAVGVPIPGMVVRIAWLIFALIVILWLFRFLMASGGIPMPG